MTRYSRITDYVSDSFNNNMGNDTKFAKMHKYSGLFDYN